MSKESTVRKYVETLTIDKKDREEVESAVMPESGDVLVRLRGDSNNDWHLGTIICSRKMWVEFKESSYMYPFIADESNIAEWKMTEACGP